jgi:hypothetical protein
MSEPTPDRRRFLKTVGLAGLSSTLIPSAISLAQTPAPAPSQPPKPVTLPAPVDTSATAKKEPVSEDAKALAEIIRRRYGKFLGNDRIATITDDLDGDLKAGPRLHAVKLANGDEPDFTFRP